MTLLVRDEVDIVRQNIAFHLQHGVDFVIVTDNGSVDGTRDILEDLSRAGPVRVLDEPAHDFSQNLWVTRMALLARDDYGADWIVNSDADEFWHVPAADLKSRLPSLDVRIDVLVCRRRNMLYAHDSLRSGPWSQELIYRVADGIPVPNVLDPLADPLPAPYFYFDLPPKVVCRARGLQSVSAGNHSARYLTKTVAQAASINVYHYPVRSFEQFESKIRNGGSAFDRNTSMPKGSGWHWRRWYRMLLGAASTRRFRKHYPRWTG